MKYVTFECPDGLTVPVIFPSQWDHSIIKRMIQSQWPGLKVKSAGKVQMLGGFVVSPSSLTLEIKPTTDSLHEDKVVFDSIPEDF
jgi:hypothetical protein